jgi:large subunit ribosomal protein L22
VKGDKNKPAVTEVRASARYLHISHRKADLVVQVVRGMKAVEAVRKLTFLNKKASPLVAKMINSALANAEHNFHLVKEDLYIKSIVSNQGPVLKRSMPAAFGTAHAIRRRLAHLEVVLSTVKPIIGKAAKHAFKKAKKLSATDRAESRKSAKKANDSRVSNAKKSEKNIKKTS